MYIHIHISYIYIYIHTYNGFIIRIISRSNSCIGMAMIIPCLGDLHGFNY